MFLKVQINKLIEENEFGNIVEFSFIDIKNSEHIFTEKWQLVNAEELTNETKYPITGFLIIEVLESNNNTVKITTSEYNRLKSDQGSDTFTVWQSDVR